MGALRGLFRGSRSTHRQAIRFVPGTTKRIVKAIPLDTLSKTKRIFSADRSRSEKNISRLGENKKGLSSFFIFYFSNNLFYKFIKIRRGLGAPPPRGKTVPRLARFLPCEHKSLIETYCVHNGLACYLFSLHF